MYTHTHTLKWKCVLISLQFYYYKKQRHHFSKHFEKVNTQVKQVETFLQQKCPTM